MASSTDRHSPLRFPYIAAFLPALAEHTSHLTPLTTKEADKEFPPWTEAHQRAFQSIKDLVTGSDCLTVIDYSDSTKKIFLTTDASDRRTGAVLSFGETWETARPVAFDSYQLNSAERNYPVHEKELLAIIKAMKKWRTSLLNVHFDVMTDHRTLEYFQAQNDMSRRQARWSMYMADFDHEIHYIKGEDNPVADALSRLPDSESENQSTPLVAAILLSQTRVPKREHISGVSAGILSISTHTELLDRIITGYETDDFCKQVEEDIASGSIVGVRRSPDQKLVYIGSRLLIPKDLGVRELLYHLAHDCLGHFGFDKS